MTAFPHLLTRRELANVLRISPRAPPPATRPGRRAWGGTGSRPAAPRPTPGAGSEPAAGSFPEHLTLPQPDKPLAAGDQGTVPLFPAAGEGDSFHAEDLQAHLQG